MKALLARTDGQILTSLPGVAVLRAAAFAAHSLPIARFPDAEHLYSATGLAPALYESASLRKRSRISRKDWPSTADALMGIAWGGSVDLHPASPNATPSSAPAEWPRSRPGSRSPATRAA